VSTGLRPISTSPVTFAVPSGAYTLAFQASGGPCWVGIERGAVALRLDAECGSGGHLQGIGDADSRPRGAVSLRPHRERAHRRFADRGNAGL
jgi:hypothetical protein